MIIFALLYNIMSLIGYIVSLFVPFIRWFFTMSGPLQSVAGSKEVAKHTNEEKQSEKGEGLSEMGEDTFTIL